MDLVANLTLMNAVTSHVETAVLVKMDSTNIYVNVDLVMKVGSVKER